MTDHIDELKRLARQNALFALGKPIATIIDSLMSADEVPLVVVPMRDVWMSGTRLKGIRPLVTVTDRQVIVVTYMGRLIWRGPPKHVRFNRSDIVQISEYSGRAFEMTLANGQTVKMRGLIGGKHEDQMPLHLYQIISNR